MASAAAASALRHVHLAEQQRRSKGPGRGPPQRMISTSSCQTAVALAADLAAVALLLLRAEAGMLLGGLSYPAIRYDKCR